LAELPAEPSWIWDGILAREQVTMLTGKPFGGKSTLLLGLLTALSREAEFLGCATSPATALVVSEENPYAFKSHVERFGCDDTDHVCITSADGLLALAWEDLIEQATEAAVDEGHDLLVIDSFAGLARLGSEEENDSAAITDKLRPLQEAASYGLAVLFLHHMGHQGRPRGSTAFSAVADISTRLIRNDEQHQFTLKTQSRFHPPEPIKATLDTSEQPNRYRLVSSAGERRAEKVDIDKLIVKTLRDRVGAGLATEEVGARNGLTLDQAKKRLPRLLKAGQVERDGEGVKGNPYRYRAA
jgi:predicted ATP-dependent serine protease